jgi:hypothetical protein
MFKSVSSHSIQGYTLTYSFQLACLHSVSNSTSNMNGPEIYLNLATNDVSNDNVSVNSHFALDNLIA